MLENRLYTHFALLKSNLFSLFRFKLSLLLIRGNAVLVSSTAYRTVPQLLPTVPYRPTYFFSTPSGTGTVRYQYRALSGSDFLVSFEKQNLLLQ
jgi:hypothetical protein